MARTTKTAAKSVVQADEQMTIVCLYCGKAQQVGRRAMSLPCRFCLKSLRVEDIVLNRYEARRLIETCGSITIESNGNVFADLTCGSLLVRGQLKGNVVCRGALVIDATAPLPGANTAPAIRVIDGARIIGKCRIGQAVSQGAFQRASAAP
jgi:hypothetical protein